MAWCLIFWKAIKVRRAYTRLKRAKKNAYREAIGLPPIYPLWERPFRWIGGKLKILALNTCCRCCKPRAGGLPSSWSKLWMKGTLPNEILKAIVGFVVGIIFSKLMLDFMTSQLNFHAAVVYWFFVVFGIVLTFGLTFSDTARCLFILTIPQFFNSKGRAALLGYLFVLALSGPGKNTAMNMEVLTESLVCGQEMVKESTQELVSLATAPWSALKTAVSVIIESLGGVVGRMRKELSGVVDVIYDIINIIKRAYALLKNVADMCNSKVGTPFDRCMTAFDEASRECTREMGKTFSWMCSPLDVFRHFCQFAKIPSAIFCWVPSLIKEHIFEPLKEHFKTFANSFSRFFDLKPLNFTYEFRHELTQDKTLGEIARNMKAEIMGHVSWFLDYVDWMDLAISGFMLLVIWKAFTYRYKYLNSDEYDNYYLSKAMIRMDLRRKKIGKASIFPLRYRECKIYVQTFSWTLIKEEMRHRQLAFIFVSIAAVQICNYILMDYLLYSFLELIREYGSVKLDTKEALGFAFTIEGEGFIAEMYRTILKGLSPMGGLLPSFDTTKCLPVAHTPNYLQYALILSLLLLCFFIAAMEPYGLRLRHIICGWIYEKRVVQRETWLYQHILSTRDNFLDFARSQIKAQVKGDRSVYRVSLMDRIFHTIPFCKRFFKTHTKKCFLCGRPGELEDFEYFVECPNCHTVYCKECFADMGQKCLACMKRINYEELSEFSEEFDSDGDSDEDRDLIEICCSRMCSCSSCAKKSISKARSKLRSKSRSKSSKATKIVGKNTRYKNVAYQKLESSPKKTPPKKSTKSKSLVKSKSPRATRSLPAQKSKPTAPKSLPSKSMSPKARTKLTSKNASKHSGMLNTLFSSMASKISSVKPKSKGKGTLKKLIPKSKSPNKKRSPRTKDKFSHIKYKKLNVSRNNKSPPNSVRRNNVSKSKDSRNASKLRSVSTKKTTTVQKSTNSSPKNNPIMKSRANSLSPTKFSRSKRQGPPAAKIPLSKNSPQRNGNVNGNRSRPGRPRDRTSPAAKQPRSRSKSTSKGRQKQQKQQIMKSHDQNVHPNKKSSSRKRGRRRGRQNHAEDHEGSCEECQLENAWWNRQHLEPFRHPPKKIAPSLRSRVEYLNTFYQQKLYPPHCNL